MVQAIIGGLSPQAQQFVNKTTQPTPKYYCSTCIKLKDGCFCDCFIRPVDAEHNKCFNHSNYSQRLIIFKAPDNLDAIIEAEEKKRLA
jgi:hypothetical protein